MSIRTRTLFLVAACTTPATAFASGLQLRDFDPQSTGSAYVGGVTRANDPATVMLNPAGMTDLEGMQLENNAYFVSPNVSFNARNVNAAGGLTSGSTSGHLADPAAAGAAYGVLPLGPNWRIGWGLTSPFGGRIDYPSDWVGRYHSLVTSITIFDATAAIAWRVNKHLSIAAGPQIAYGSARFTEALNLGPAFDAGAGTIGEISGNGFAYGYIAGLLYKIDDRTRIGINYRSRLQVNYWGKQQITTNNAISAIPAIKNLLVSESGHVTTQAALPDILSFGVEHRFGDRLTLRLEAEWSHNSLVQNLAFVSDHGVPTTTIPVPEQNSWFGGISADYRFTPKLDAYGGFSYDERATAVDQLTTRIPDTDRYTLSGGLSWQVAPRVKLSVGYAHIFTTPLNVAITEASTVGSAGKLIGRYDPSANVVNTGIAVRF
ncbi:TonB-dependent receptor [Acetobacteraceae bacterium KSS8]|uniref:TonB-dependent receptor n=1 Tax=Endosaccharibacter trunci TaxID=2812733 RepID=A0ABT1W889_9PROT|nr:TonB-dependent receptor [Acetobacteraceae bacterium KSS8]